MPSALLMSQLETLEPLQRDEPGLTRNPREGLKTTADQIFARWGRLVVKYLSQRPFGSRSCCWMSQGCLMFWLRPGNGCSMSRGIGRSRRA